MSFSADSRGSMVISGLTSVVLAAFTPEAENPVVWKTSLVGGPASGPLRIAEPSAAAW